MAHFFSKKYHRRHVVTLCVRRMLSPHTAQHIREMVEEVLDELELPLDKIPAILTDSESNIVAAFHQCALALREEEVLRDSDEECDEDLLQVEVDDFESKELDHDVTFLNRLACFAHLLQLVRKFEEVTTYKALLQRVRALIKTVNMSTKATEKLVFLRS